MSSKARVCFIGNCQADVLGSMASFLGAPVEIVKVPANFRADLYKSSDVVDVIRSADIVFNQRVSEDYVIDYIRPSALKEVFGENSVTWPVIYFDGYFPGISYIYSKAGKITGPVSDYHFDFVRKSWSAGEEIATLMQRFMEGAVETQALGPAERSLVQLREREQGLDTVISDYIEDNFRHRKLFHSMNHPESHVIFTMLERLLDRIGIALPGDNRIDDFRYRLNRIMIPPFPFLTGRYELRFDDPPGIKGNDLVLARGMLGAGEQVVMYGWEDLFEAYFRLYDANRQFLEHSRHALNN